MKNPITYKIVRDRCQSIAMELSPDMPTVADKMSFNNPQEYKAALVEAWQDFVEQMEHLNNDGYSLVLEAVESTDWAIYTHYGWKILHAVPQDVINDAESQYLEFNAGLTIEDTCGGCFDIWSLQSAIAFHVLVAMVQEYLDTAIDELLDLAQTQLDNLESDLC